MGPHPISTFSLVSWKWYCPVGLEFFILKFTQPLQRYLLTCQAKSASLGWFFCTGQLKLWRVSVNFKIRNSRPLFTTIFKPKIVVSWLKISVTYSSLSRWFDVCLLYWYHKRNIQFLVIVWCCRKLQKLGRGLFDTHKIWKHHASP